MEPRQNPPASERSPFSESPSEGKIARIAGHTRGLIEDLQEWVDLRLDLAIMEMEERVDRVRNEFARALALAFFGFFAVLFVLTTTALGLGWALGHPFWGFLIVTGLLVLISGGLAQFRPDLLPSSNLYNRVRGPASSPGEKEPTQRREDSDLEEDPSV